MDNAHTTTYPGREKTIFNLPINITALVTVVVLFGAFLFDMNPTTPNPIAIGPLNWPGSERRSDRYGRIAFWGQDIYEPVVNSTLMHELVGKSGKLRCRIRQPRKSTHIGDLFRGLFPSLPEEGEDLFLGEGEFFITEEVEGAVPFGVRPHDGRDSDWLDPEQLYRCHESICEVYFVTD